MARLQELHPDQQAALRLILGRRMSYAELAGVLGLPADRVRERALDAVDGLAPDDVDGLGLDDRDRIADYLLGQQDEAQAATTERLIAESAPAREWLGRLTPELSELAAGSLPLPDPREPTDEGAAEPSARPSSAGITAAFAALDPPLAGSRRLPTGLREALGGRAGRIAAAVTGVVALVLVVLLVTGTFGGDDEVGTTAETPTTTTEPSEAALAAAVASALPQQINLTPPESATGDAREAAGVGLTNINDNVPGIVFTAENLPKLEGNRVYSIWVDGGGQPTALLGRLDKVAETDEPLVDEDGNVAQVFVPFATLDSTTNQTRVIDVRPYERIRVTRESPNATKPGPTVLSGSLKP